MEIKNLSKAAQFEIMVKLRLPELQRLYFAGLDVPDKVWIKRAEFLGTELDTRYISIYEKYLQIAAFNNEVGYGSQKHVPLEKCFIYGVKSGDSQLVDYYIDIAKSTGFDFRGLDMATILSFNNDLVFKVLKHNPVLPYRSYIPAANYNKAFQMMEDKEILLDVRESIEVLAKFCPLEILEKLELYQVQNRILEAAAGTLDSRYFGVMEALEIHRDSWLYYLLDWAPKNILQRLNPLTCIFFGCPNLLSKLKLGEIPEFMVHYVPKLPPERLKELIKVLNFHTGNQNPEWDAWVYCGIEYWTWIWRGQSAMKKRQLPDSLTRLIWEKFEIVKPKLEKYLIDVGNPEILKKWVEFTTYIDGNISPEVYPEFMDILENLVLNKKYEKYMRFLLNYYTPGIYVASYKLLTPEQKVYFVPTAELVSQIPKISKLAKNLEIFPKFLEPKTFIKSKK